MARKNSAKVVSDIDITMHQRARRKALDDGVSLAEVVRQLITMWLTGQVKIKH